MFEEFLQLLGDKVRLRGFDKYKGGLGKILQNIYSRSLINLRPCLLSSFQQILFMT